MKLTEWRASRLAVDYCFLTNEGMEAHPELVVEPFDAKSEQNDYEVRVGARIIPSSHLCLFGVSDSVGAPGRYC